MAASTLGTYTKIRKADTICCFCEIEWLVRVIGDFYSNMDIVKNSNRTVDVGNGNEFLVTIEIHGYEKESRKSKRSQTQNALY